MLSLESFIIIIASVQVITNLLFFSTVVDMYDDEQGKLWIGLVSMC